MDKVLKGINISNEKNRTQNIVRSTSGVTMSMIALGKPDAYFFYRHEIS